jgi:ribosomal protein L11 methylase PrmA
MRGKISDTDLIHTNLFGYEIALVRHRYNMTINEMGLWERIYAPISLKGKIVLDVGAGMGESAAFYFSKGAEKIVAIEPNPQDLKLLRINATRNAWNVDSIHDVFRLDQLSIPHDFAKIDCEGGEEILLEYNGRLGPCVIESHTRDLTRKLSEKFHFDAIIDPANGKSEAKLLLKLE